MTAGKYISIFEFGNIKFTGEVDGIVKSLEYDVTGTLSYKRDIKVFPAGITGRVITKLRGFYPIVKVDVISAMRNDAQKNNDLVKMLNSLVGLNRTIRISPRGGNEADGVVSGFTGDFYLASDFNPEDLVKYDSAGQRVNLQFQGVQRLPKMYESQLTSTWEYTTGDYIVFGLDDGTEDTAAFSLANYQD